MYEGSAGIKATETPQVEVKTREISKSCEELQMVIEGLEKRLDRYLLHSPSVLKIEVRPSDPHSEFYSQLDGIESTLNGLIYRVSNILGELEL